MQADALRRTPEQLKAMKGPSADDPLEDPTAASWVRQFNEELAAPSANAAERAPLFGALLRASNPATAKCATNNATCISTTLGCAKTCVLVIWGTIWSRVEYTCQRTGC